MAESSASGKKRSRVQSGPLKHLPRSPSSSSSSSRVPPKADAHAGEEEGSASETNEMASSCQLIFTEVKGDLFACPPHTSLAHCVSEDMAMGKGIATLFKSKFGGVGELKAQGVRTGGVAILEMEDRFIYYLVTKQRFFHKPTYSSLSSSLQAMRLHCQQKSVRSLALPRIGCGLDGLRWDKVSQMIGKVFSGLDITITVYYL